MPDRKEKIRRFGDPELSDSGAFCFALVFIALGVCLAELVRIFFMWMALSPAA